MFERVSSTIPVSSLFLAAEAWRPDEYKLSSIRTKDLVERLESAVRRQCAMRCHIEAVLVRGLTVQLKAVFRGLVLCRDRPCVGQQHPQFLFFLRHFTGCRHKV